MKFPRSFQQALVLFATSTAVLEISSQALACQTVAGTSDTALMNTFPIPTFSSAGKFVAQQAIDFEMLRDSWKGHGSEAFDDARFEYTKHWMSSYLISQGHVFEHRVKGTDGEGQQLDLLLDRAFHTTQDYYTMAKGAPTANWHDLFISLLGGNDPVKLGFYQFSVEPPFSAVLFFPLAFFPEKTETVTTFCGLFDVQEHTDPDPDHNLPGFFLPNTVNIYGTPSERASDLVHEGMHSHYRDNHGLDHVSCVKDKNDGGCDHFFAHPKSDFTGGDLNKANGSNEKIPAYELQLEYLCDLVDEAQDWVPLALLSDAEGTADRTAQSHFVNALGNLAPPPYDCGVPSPMMGVPSPSCSLAACDDQNPCGEGGFCDNGCCVVIK